MILTTNQRALMEQAFAKKYGEETIRHPSTFWKSKEELEKFRTEEIPLDNERWKSHRVVPEKKKLSDDVTIESTRMKAYEEDLSCEICGKGEIVFTTHDYFYVFKHECCEKCYFAHKQ